MEGEDNSSPYKIEYIHILVRYLFLIHCDSLYTKKASFKQHALWYEFCYQKQEYYGYCLRWSSLLLVPQHIRWAMAPWSVPHEMRILYLPIDTWP